jgi:hypothetical protein
LVEGEAGFKGLAPFWSAVRLKDDCEMDSLPYRFVMINESQANFNILNLNRLFKLLS